MYRTIPNLQSAQVGIVMGSDSDLPVMSKAAEMLDKFGISYEVTVISAHRMPDIFSNNASSEVANIFAAKIPAFCAPLIATVATGIPPGICTME